MGKVRAKKHLGQHFLTDLSIARDIANSLSLEGYNKVLEIGPGMGVLTQFLLARDTETFVIEIDTESVGYLQAHFPTLENHIIEGDFLKLPVDQLFKEPFALIGNFPYNISSQILFKALEHKDQIPEMAGMFQKEVAERVASKPGKKAYGIISVLLQTYYDIEYLFTVDEHVFNPPPKVKSGVIRLKRNKVTKLPCSEKMYVRVVKTAFSQRRKTLRNALKSLTLVDTKKAAPFLGLRAEQLSVDDFIQLTQCFEA
ncbi:MAG: 16S rRNA (adenine(1518)-N(6)/adenine(1519)-N(6))-dimethyltransferase RsmA [Bacteroidetes bacterium]|nr:16S rRNA (adenine(1518)-N(6)/adenine(1519)-N(6))-dimethyltransferase RsmA [Bacteroidota bacterium]